MAVDVTIKNKGLFKKELKLEDILIDNQSYGIMDENFRLEEGKKGDYTVIFNKNNICRGYELSIKKGEVNLSMPLPTSDDDITFFYEYIKVICQKMNTKVFTRDEEEVSIDRIQEFIDLDINTSEQALKQIEENINNGTYENMYIFGALNPISLGKKELDKIKCSPKKLGKLLNELQNIDAYYAIPKIYQKPTNELFGTYILTENVLSILPYKPTLLTTKDLKIEEWYIGFVTEEKLSGFVPYKDFIDFVKKEKEYDSEHFLISTNKEEIEELLRNYKIEI